MEVRARAPLRLGLAGGGTDVSPYCDVHGGCVLNATIDRFSYATIKTQDQDYVRLVATDLQKEIVSPISESLELNGTLDLHKSVYREMIQRYNGGKPVPLEVSTFCEASAGSGLGSSSALAVVLIKAFTEFFNLALDDYAIAKLAFHVERVECGQRGGRQDQYAAAFGGFNFMEFYANEHAVINPFRIKNWIICELEASLILFNTGVSRESAKIIAEQSANMELGVMDAIEGMHGLKREALAMKECLLKGDFEGIVECMRKGWESKKLTARGVSNPGIDEVYSAALDAGAAAGKISGAGGGGYIIFYVPPDNRMEVIRRLEKFRGQVSNCHFTKEGAQAWRIRN
jgi:D-glycero-alpha-D-manno-heptose-7-phosphate kinase